MELRDRVEVNMNDANNCITYKFFKELKKNCIGKIQLKGGGKSWEDRESQNPLCAQGQRQTEKRDSKYLHQLKYIPPNWPSIQ